jgi:hypothetical protein
MNDDDIIRQCIEGGSVCAIGGQMKIIAQNEQTENSVLESVKTL